MEPIMARKAFVPTELMRGKVKYLAGVGVRQDDIAKIIGCSPKTLRRRFRDELDRGLAEATATVAGYLFNKAKEGNIAAIIFWLKVNGWRENPLSSESESEPEPKPARRAVVILPDNHRGPPQDPGLVAALIKTQDKYSAKKQRSESRKTT